MYTEDGHFIAKCLAGEPEAFDILVEKYKASIYALAYAKFRNPSRIISKKVQKKIT